MRWCLFFCFLVSVFSGPWVLDVLISPHSIRASFSITCLSLYSPHRPYAPHLTCFFSPVPEIWLVLFLFPQYLVILTFTNWDEEINILLITAIFAYWKRPSVNSMSMIQRNDSLIQKSSGSRQADGEIMSIPLRVAFACTCVCVFWPEDCC